MFWDNTHSVGEAGDGKATNYSVWTASTERKQHMGKQKQLAESLPEERRKEIFAALVEAQDQELAVAASRKLVAERFGATEEQVRQIESEGVDHEWPPL